VMFYHWKIPSFARNSEFNSDGYTIIILVQK
jgi:hypothetical protein